MCSGIQERCCPWKSQAENDRILYWEQREWEKGVEGDTQGQWHVNVSEEEAAWKWSCGEAGRDVVRNLRHHGVTDYKKGNILKNVSIIDSAPYGIWVEQKKALKIHSIFGH